MRTHILKLIVIGLLIIQPAAVIALESDELWEMSLEELLSLEVTEIRAGEAGSYALQLFETIGDSIGTIVHGYLTTESKYNRTDDTDNFTFDLHHATVMFRTELTDRVTAEMALEWEHAGTDFYMPFGFADIVLNSFSIARVGYFVTPVGAFNEYQYSDFLRKTAQAPLLTREVVPALWSEVGVQIRGKAAIRGNISANYALFVSNGLEQADSDPSDGIVSDGGQISDMKRTGQDKMDPNKAFGGRLGLTVDKGINVGVSGYSGAYTTDGEKRLSIIDGDFSWQRGRWLIRAEAALAIQETQTGDLEKSGAYFLAAYRLAPQWEPYIQIETVDLDAGPEAIQNGLTAGLIFFPFPQKLQHMMLKSEWSYFEDDADNTLYKNVTQLTVSF